jgi:hypothetical protein
MTYKRVQIGLLLVIGLCALSGAVLAQSGVGPLGLEPGPSPSPSDVSIWTNKTQYTVGENATVYFSISAPGFVYIWDIEPDGIVRRLFPNAYDTANYFQAGVHTLPRYGWTLTAQPPYGSYNLQIVYSPTALPISTSYYEAFPMTGTDPGSAGVQIMGLVPQGNWTTAYTPYSIITGYSYGSPSSPSYPSYPFYPPFVGWPGGTWYWSDGAWHYGIPSTGWYWYWGSDGQWHFRIQIIIGG